MNREQKRRALKEVNTPYKFNQAMSYGLDMQKRDLEQRFNAQKKDIIDIILTMTAYTIQYKLGLGKKRLPEIMNAILNNIDSFNTGHLTKQDFDFIKEDLKRYNFYV